MPVQDWFLEKKDMYVTMSYKCVTVVTSQAELFDAMKTTVEEEVIRRAQTSRHYGLAVAILFEAVTWEGGAVYTSKAGLY